MNIADQEKTAWISLATLLVAWGYYFARILEMYRADDLRVWPMVGLMIGVTIAMVVVQVGFHIVVATTAALADPSRTELEVDERDRLIDAKSIRNAYYVLAAGVVTTIGVLVIGSIAGTAAIGEVNPLVVANVCLIGFIAAEVMRTASQLFYYRRGV